MGKEKLICKDCTCEIFADVNMVMLKDALWKRITDNVKDAYCDTCIEKRLGRKISPNDFKKAGLGMDCIPCNYMWLMESKYDFWRDNKKDQHYTLTGEELRKHYGTYLLTKEQDWRERYGTIETMTAFIASSKSEKGLSSVFEQTDIAKMETLLRPVFMKVTYNK